MPAPTCFPLELCSTRWSTGFVPFRGESIGVVAEAILNRTPVAPVRLNPDVPPKLEEIINKALEKDRKLRYQSAADIRTDLQRLRRDSESVRAVATTTQRRVEACHEAQSMVDGRWRGNTGDRTGCGRRLFYPHKVHALTDKDTIVLADFANATGDPVFDGTLRQGLSVQLEQSPFLSIISDEQDPADPRPDGPARRCKADTGDCARGLPADGERRGARWFDCARLAPSTF